MLAEVLASMLGVGALATALVSVLALARRRFAVWEDPRVGEVERRLPATNCGACGYPGCRAFAEALVAGAVPPAGCTVSNDADRQAIATYLGVEVGVQAKLVARLACAGGSNVARHRARYDGLRSCGAEALVAGGSKGCRWGCLGLGDCVRVCDFDALEMDAHDLPVVDEDKCTACGDCVEECPKDLFSLQPAEDNLWVACWSRLAGDDALLDCDVACNACGRCAADEPGSIEMRDARPVIRDARPENDRAIQRCPTGAIVWLEAGRIRRGVAAPAVLRQRPRPCAPT